MTAAPVPARTPAALLDSALRADPARALLTYYDDATGERTELSVATFANWVAKTANLCRDDLGLEVGDTIVLDLPLHWQSAVWWQTCWASGLVPTPAEGADPTHEYDAAVVAVGAERDRPLPPAAEVVGLGLGPMGLPVPGSAAPSEVTLDYDREVHGHGDRFTPPPGLGATTPALRLGETTLRGSELGAQVEDAVRRWDLTAADRVLTTTPYTDLPSLLGGLLAPLAAGAGVVLCRNVERIDQAALARRILQEGVTAVTSGADLGAFGVRRLD
ncbi:MAG: TIGR03089 family protein [Actinomycetes bacterium]